MLPDQHADGTTVATVRLDSADPQTVWRFLDDAYGASLRLQEDPGEVRFERSGHGLVSVDELKLSGRISFDADPLTTFTVIECRAGHGVFDRHGLSDGLAPGEVIGISSPGFGHAGSCGDLDIRLVNLDAQVLRSTAAEIQGTDRELRFDRLRLVEPRDLALWTRLADFVSLAAQPDRMCAGGLAERDLARIVARTALKVFPNSTWAEPTSARLRQDGRDASAASVRRAAAFIDSSADRDLTLADIAAAAHVSPRALQAGFRRHLDTTPMRYLQRARLQLVRRALTGGGGAASVASVASKWGFHNHGRFAAVYRAEFGELPSATLAGGDQPGDPTASSPERSLE